MLKTIELYFMGNKGICARELELRQNTPDRL